jgi:hypothetical protein
MQAGAEGFSAFPACFKARNTPTIRFTLHPTWPIVVNR